MIEASAYEVFSLLYLPFLMCMVLVGIHCYLGLHVLERGVIFVDLSLAQIAALGSSVALLFGFEVKSLGAYLLALLSTFVAAAIFARARSFEARIPQEAIIGVTYALGSAAVILVLDKVAHGGEQIKNLLIGQILWVTWADFYKVTVIYGCVAIVHYLCRRPIFMASRGENFKGRGFWDFVFYALFGIVITSSVSVAGVLQVFAYLIVPSLIARVFVKSTSRRVLLGWLLGFIVSAAAMAFSYALDLPSGAVIVVCFTVLPIMLVLLPAKLLQPKL